MEKSYTRTRDFQISKDVMVEKLTSVLPHYAVVPPSGSSSAIIEAVATPSALIPLEFPFRVEVQTFRNHYSRVILTCLSPSTHKQEILAARLLFPAILKSQPLVPSIQNDGRWIACSKPTHSFLG
jgi:hypothetical protein